MRMCHTSRQIAQSRHLVIMHASVYAEHEMLDHA